MLKVVHIITRLDMGGSAQNTLKTCIGLAGDQYKIVLVSGASRESNMTEAESDAVGFGLDLAATQGVSVEVVPALIRRIDPVMDTLALVGLMRLIRKEKPHIIHTHTSKAGILGRMAARLSGVPIIVHTPHGHVFYGHFSKILSKVFLIIERVFDIITDCTIALTTGERDDYLNKHVSKSDKLQIIHSGVDVVKFMAPLNGENKKRASLGLVPAVQVVGTAGWLLPIKGPVYLFKAMLEVWKAHPEIKLVFVGKGELEVNLKKMAKDLGVNEKIRFLGWRNNVQEILPLFDIFVLPSLNEGMGRVIVEALAAGKPVVASNTGGIPDLVKNGETGYLVEPRDVSGLAQAINKLIEKPSLRRSMGMAGQQRSHLFSEELMIKKIDELYQELLT